MVGPEKVRVRILDAQSSSKIASDLSLAGKAVSSMQILMRMGSGAERSIMARDQETESPRVIDDQSSGMPSAAERQ